ncbi:hypothetical protein BCV69DRAFT_3151 [Microstroma glucosiphilum]|uniref:MARVEL domain-containing protein n=1 Tax=Pseudomicrostroma glucosiphilum TaxID=1684307 RepID=A0A316UI05_9BASI|nr:hypothetical protein BCV69DRAFT_3151 [Pseudomicrostroma glucosiphilum]PWN23563.1 hypothetical protein BCV69DRAFT_3151 [Pseudomicrostroma glucosiphilum]
MVDLGSHIRRGHPAAFGLLAFISLIVGIISAVITADYENNDTGANGNYTGLVTRVHFAVFYGWWTFVFSIIYLALFLTGVGGVVTSIAGHGIWLLLTWIFWLAGAGALADTLGTSCGTSRYYYCNSLQALHAFSWIGWILLTLMLVVVAAIGGGAFRGGRGLKDGLSEA